MIVARFMRLGELCVGKKICHQDLSRWKTMMFTYGLLAWIDPEGKWRS